MKKILSIMAAAAILAGCCSCSEKKNDKDNDKNDTEIISETETEGEQALDEPVEQEFRTYSADYFKTINVNTNVTEAKSPIKSHNINLSQLDFGSRISPCRDEKYIERYNYIKDGTFDEAYRKQIEEMWEKSKTEPAYGVVGDVCIEGRYIYAIVSYDVMCKEGMHEVSIFRLDSETNEKEELFRYSNPEESCMIYDIYCLNGVIYLYKYGSGICYLDEEKQELVMIKELSEDISIRFRPNSTGRFIVEIEKEEKELVPNDYEPKAGEELYSYDGTQTYLMKGRETSIEEFDFDTKTWKQLYYVKTGPNENVESGTPEYPEISGKYFSWKEKPEKSRKYDIVTEKYRVSTGLTGCEVKYADDNKVIAIQYNLQGSGANESRLHIYDLRKAEHYVIDSSKYGSRFSVLGDGLIISKTSGDGDLYYLVPELGMLFNLGSLGGVNMTATTNYYSETYVASGDVVTFDVLKQTNPHEVHVDGATYTDYDFENELYWFTLEE